MPSEIKPENSPRSVHRFVRFEDEQSRQREGSNSTTTASAERYNSSPQTKVVDQISYGSSSSSSSSSALGDNSSGSLTKNFGDPKSSSADNHSAPDDVRCLDQLPSQYSCECPKPKKISTDTTNNNNQVTQLIRNFENGATATKMSRQAGAVVVIQTAFRVYKSRQCLREKKIAHQRNLPRIYAAIKIQSTVRAWVARLKARILGLEKDLHRSQTLKAYSVRWIQERNHNEMKRFEEAERYKAREALRKATHNVTKTQATIAEMREGNKKLRTQNQTLTEASAILSQKCATAQETYETQLKEIATLEADIVQLQGEEKRFASAASMYAKFVGHFSETLEQVNEHSETEHVCKLLFKESMEKIMNLLRTTSKDEGLLHEVRHLGTSTFLTGTKDPRDFESDVSRVTNTKGVAKPNFRSTDVSETETSDFILSDGDDEGEDLSDSCQANMLKANANAKLSTFETASIRLGFIKKVDD